VKGGHSIAVNIEFEKAFELQDVFELLNHCKGIIVVDDPSRNNYPMPLYVENHDEVFVGRIRRDFSVKNGLNLWVVADNLRKGAATNAVQIADFLIKSQMIS
jgi:aspartate-semialdehyde dehydrogenase